MGLFETLFATITRHTRIAIAAMLVLTIVLGAGAGAVEQSSSLDQFQSETPESATLDYINTNFTTGQGNTTSVQIIVRDDNVLDQDSLSEMLAMQAAFRANDAVNATLADNQSIVGLANIVATAGIQQEIGGELQRTSAAFNQRQTALNQTAGGLQQALNATLADPTTTARAQFEQVQASAPVELDEEDFATFNQSVQLLRTADSQREREQAYMLGTQGVLEEEYQALERLGGELQTLQAELERAQTASLAAQREQLDSMNQSEIDAVLSQVFGGQGGGVAFQLMPTGYEPGNETANATMLILRQKAGPTAQYGGASEAVIDAQLTIQEIAGESIAENDEAITFGGGLITDEINRSMTDSLSIVGPLALLFVIVALVIGYRDVLDILLGVTGISLVLVMTFGFMGWADIAFNQMFVAVPVLLIGLSIDYAIHTFMRHREERNNGHAEDGVRDSMRVALSGVGIALVWVTATTAIGFLSNLTSPVPPIQEFGVVSAAGIIFALLVFGALVPSLKIEIDEFLENRGIDRRKRAFGTSGGRLSSALQVGAVMARKAPYVVILLAVLISAAGAYGGSQVDTSFNQEDFLAEDPPDWTENLPEPFKPGEYSAKENLNYVNENFLRQDAQAQVLVEGPVASGDALTDLVDAREAAGDKDSVQIIAGGTADIQDPLSVMQSVAAENETFNATYQAALGANDIPTRNVAEVYDTLFAVAPDEASSVIYRSEEGYESMRMVISTKGTASSGDVTTDIRDVATNFDSQGLAATATGQTILFKIIQDQLLQTVIESLLLTLVAVFAFLMITYRITEGSATLGAVTLLPVVLSVSWILGTMFLLGIPFNILTGMITSLTVGLGVAYSIHLSERYNQELERADSMWDAMCTAVTGTGGALLGSAATTVGGFGVLIFAILPPLQQFGLITGLTIIYALLASVLVLPSLLVVWTRFFGPDDIADDETSVPDDPTGS